MAVSDADGPQLLGIFDRDGAKANGINKLKDGGVGADAEGEGQDGDDGEAGAQAKKPKSVAKVAPEIGHGYPSAL